MEEKMAKNNLKVMPGKKKNKKDDLLRDFKTKQYQDLVDDYGKIRKNLDYMSDVLDAALTKIENNIK